MYIVILCINCVLIGLLLGRLLRDHQLKKHIIGNLRIDNSTGDSYMFLELNDKAGGVLGVMRKEWVILKVELENYPQ